MQATHALMCAYLSQSFMMLIFISTCMPHASFGLSTTNEYFILLRCLDCQQRARTRNHMPPFDGILHRNELRSDRKEIETKKCGKAKDRNNHKNLNNRLHGIPL